MYQNQNEHCIGADSTLICAVLVTVAILFVTDIAMADYGEVLYHQKISDTEGGFTGELGNGDWFGIGTAPLGDLDGDGVGDLAVGAVCDDDGGNGHGAVWILFLNTDGTIKSTPTEQSSRTRRSVIRRAASPANWITLISSATSSLAWGTSMMMVWWIWPFQRPAMMMAASLRMQIAVLCGFCFSTTTVR